MKKLLLTSNGLTSAALKKAFIELLAKPPAEAVVKALTAIFTRLGIKKRNIHYADIRAHATLPMVFDVFFVCGGNTFYILQRTRALGFDAAIKEFVRKGGLYVGLSAGSIIAGKTIEIAGWGTEGDRNYPGLRDLRGLGLTDIAVFPHYKTRFRREVRDFAKRISYPVVALRDRQAIAVTGTHAALIG
jgi:dipeptidase E